MPSGWDIAIEFMNFTVFTCRNPSQDRICHHIFLPGLRATVSKRFSEKPCSYLVLWESIPFSSVVSPLIICSCSSNNRHSCSWKQGQLNSLCQKGGKTTTNKIGVWVGKRILVEDRREREYRMGLRTLMTQNIRVWNVKEQNHNKKQYRILKLLLASRHS